MSLLERAQQFINNGGDRTELLHDCLADGSLSALAAVQLLFEDMYGGMTFNLEIKASAGFCLIRWGRAGLEALVEAARRTPKSKNRSIALELLASIAGGERRTVFAQFAGYPLIEEVDALCSEWSSLPDVARSLLTEFVLELPVEEVAFALGHQFMAYSMVLGTAAIRELFEAFAVRLIAVGEPVLVEFERLIVSSPADERAFQAFLTAHPQLLEPMAVEIWPQPSLWGAREPDFVIRRADDTYLVVEIECPSKLLVTATGQLSADSSHAVNQVLDYADRLVQRQELIASVFPRFRAPDCLVVNGLELPLSSQQTRMLTLENAHRRGVRICGFDWLASRARAIMKGYVAHRVLVSKARLE